MSNKAKVRSGKFNWCDTSEVSTIADFYLDETAPLFNGEKLGGSFDFGEGDCRDDADGMTVFEVALHCQEYHKRLITSKKKKLDALVEYLKTTEASDNISYYEERLKIVGADIERLEKKKAMYASELQLIKDSQ